MRCLFFFYLYCDPQDLHVRTCDFPIRLSSDRPGDTALHRRFTYWKPRLALSRALGGEDQLRASIERSVGQLDFEDFVASASLDRDQVSAGAVDLRPSRTWRVSVASRSEEHTSEIQSLMRN